MAATIKGITVQIGSDTTGLQAALSDVNKHARDIQSELRQVERLLKFNPHDIELLAQKQQLLADQVENTRKKLDTLKIAQEQVNEQFRKGEISQEQYRAFQRELVKTESQLKDYEKQLRAVNLQNHEFNQRMQEMGKKLQDVGKQLTDVGKTLSTRLTAPLTALGAVAAKSAIDFEGAFAGVRKTVSATEQEFEALSKGIRDMAKEIPASANEIAGVAEAAGQLGIANEHILSFTRTMIDLGEATNMSSDEAATALARLANITQMPQSEFDRLGSTIVALGNNLATTEAEIVNMGLRLAGAGQQVGMTEAEILSLAGALSSVGIEAEAGGSAFSRLLASMQLAVETGSDELLDFASVAGMTADGFRQAFQEDAAGALIAFIRGLQSAEDQGTSAIKILDDMGITEIRLRDALLRAAGAGDLFTEAIQLGTQAWEENTALTDEAAQRYETTASKLEIMRNRLQDAAITFGEILLPPLVAVAEKVGEFADWLAGLDPKLKTTIVVVGGLAAALGPVLIVLGQIVASIGTLMPLLGTLAAFIKTTLIPAIMGISAPTIGVVAAIAALGVVAYEVYRNWDEVKNALVSLWELIKASAVQLGLNVALAFEQMKHAVLGAVNAILERLSVLEKLPFGIGNKFAGLKGSISDSVDGSAEKIAELEQRLADNAVRIAKAVDGTKVAFSDLGAAVANDVKAVVAALTGQTTAVAAEMDEQTSIIEDETAQQLQAVTETQQDMTRTVADEGAARVEATQQSEEEQTEIMTIEARKRAEARAEFEAEWNRKLFQLTADRLAQLEAEEAEALARAEALEADKTAILEYYSIKRQEILNAEIEREREAEQRRLDALAKFEEDWARKLFEATADRLEILEREKQEALARAEELGADKTAIIEYYALRQQEILDQQLREDEERERRRLQSIAEFEEFWTRKLFEQSATRLELLQRERDEAIRRAEELGADTTAILEYYANEERRILAELEAEREAARERELAAERELQAKREQQQQQWQERLFRQTASELEILEAARDKELQLAEELGLDKTAILEYYENERQKILERQRAAEEKAAEEAARKELEALEAQERARISFEEDWTKKLFQATADRLEILEREKQEALTKAEELGADKTAILEYYSLQQQRILDEQARATREAAEREAQAVAAFEEAWARKLFEQSASRLERLQRDRDEALAEAERLGADTTAILAYYAEEERRIHAETEAEKERLAQQWRDRLFELRADELEKLEAQMQAELELAERYQLDATAILEYYEERRREIQQRRQEEAEAQAQREAKAAQELAEQKAQFEEAWTRKLFEQSASRIERLRKERDEALAEAERLGADRTAILEYYAEEERRIEEETAAERERRTAEQLETLQRFRDEWNRRLFEATATELELLERAKEEAIAKAEELGAETTAIVEYYALKRQEILDRQLREDEERDRKRLQSVADFEEAWTRKLFEQSASRLEILARDRDEAIRRAEELGADTTAILEYYANEERRILAELEAEREAAHERGLAAERELQAKREQQQQQWQERLFRQTASELEILEAARDKELQLAEELGLDKTAILEYYENERQKILERQRAAEEKAAEEAARKELEALEARERARISFEEDWTKKLFQATADRLEILEREKEEALAKAEELGADKTAILEYYSLQQQRILDEQVKETQEAAEREAQAIAAFEEAWTRKLFEQSATRLELLQRDREEAIRQAEEIGADTTAILEYYAEEERRIRAETEAEKERLAQQWQNRLFELRADELEKLEAQMQAELELAERYQLDATAILEYYEERRRQILQRRQEEAEAQAQREAQVAQELAEKKAQFEESWSRKLFEQSASRIERLRRERDEALAEAERLGADRTAILEYYAEEERRIEEETAAERERHTAEQLETLQRFQDEWARRLFEATATELELLERAKEEAIAQAEELGAETTAIVEYYALKRQEILDRQLREDEERDRKRLQGVAEFEEAWTRKLFEQSATRLEILQRDRDEAIRRAEEIGADTTAILEYYANEERRIQAELEAEREAARERELKAEQDAQRERERLLRQWEKRLFEQTASELELLEARMQEELRLAEEHGLDTLAILQYYENERQKVLDRQRAAEEQAAEEAARREAQALEARERARLEFEERWARRLFELHADELELLEREKEEAVRQAEEIGADTTAVLEYYAAKELEIRRRRAEEAQKIAEAEAEAERKRIEELERARLEFEQSWEDRLFRLTASREELLLREREQALAKAAELGADVNKILEYYARRQAELAEDIAEEQRSAWEKAFDAVESPLDRFVSAVSDVAQSLMSTAKAIKAGDWRSAFLSVLSETESFAKAMELIGSVMQPVVVLFDAVLKPIVNGILGLWNGIIDALASISIFGWKPFAGLADKKIGLVGEGKGDGGTDRASRGGRQVSEITGPTRDLLTDLLSPLAHLGSIVAPIQDIRAILDARLPNFNAMQFDAVGVGGGVNFVFEPGAIVVHSSATGGVELSRDLVDSLERELAGRLAFQFRGQGR